MSSFKILLTQTAQEDYEDIDDPKVKKGIDSMIDRIRKDPFEFRALAAPLFPFRLVKTSSFQILYQINKEELVVYGIFRPESYLMRQRAGLDGAAEL